MSKQGNTYKNLSPKECLSKPAGRRAVYIKTYGCQMNVRDSEAVGALLIRSGYARADNESEADVIIVNLQCA